MEKDVSKESSITEIEEIRKKGKNLGFTYVQSLSLFLFETVLQWISESKLKDDLWLKSSDLQIKERHTGISHEMICYQREISCLDLHHAIEELLKNRESDSFHLKWEMLIFDRQIELILHTKLEQVEVPFKVMIRPIFAREQFPEEEIYPSLLSEKKEICYNAYPVGIDLAECFYEILDRLELIGDMRSYDTICWILKHYPVEGRKVYLLVKEFLEKKELPSVEKRWETILSYVSYPYMKKKWNKYRKVYREEKITWDACMKLLDEFFTPIWDAIWRDQIFFGDWMPHLERYLD